MARIGVDLDGTLRKCGFFNPSIKFPQWLFWLIFPFLSIMPLNKEAIKKMVEFKNNGNEIVIITARPPASARVTLKNLTRCGAPCDSLRCVGFGTGSKYRKWQAIKDLGVTRYYDNDPKTTSYLRKKQIVSMALSGGVK